MTNKKYHVNHHDRQRFLGRKKSSIEVAVGIYLVSLIPVNFQFPNVMECAEIEVVVRQQYC